MALARGMGMAGSKGFIMVRNDRWYKVICLIAFLTTSFAMGGQALACIFPSFTEMSKGRSMACCTEHCRMDTTPQAAQEACQKSFQVFNQQETLSSPSGTASLTFLKSLTDLGFQHIFPPPLLKSIPHLSNVVERGFHSRYQTVEIFTLNQSFLI